MSSQGLAGGFLACRCPVIPWLGPRDTEQLASDEKSDLLFHPIMDRLRFLREGVGLLCMCRGGRQGKGAHKRVSEASLSRGCARGVPGVSGPCVWLQVRFLEQQNQVLQTKWELLQQLQGNHSPQGLECVFETCLARLRQQLEGLQRDRRALDSELKTYQDQEDEYKSK